MILVTRIFFLLALLCSSQAFASGSKSFDSHGFHITIEPLVGYEMKQVSTPTVHTRAMVMYGARFTIGHKYLSGEGEYTMGSVNETALVQGTNVKTDKQNVRLGLRSSHAINAWSDASFRAGGQASKTKVATTTVATASTLTDEGKWEIHPYAGIGFVAHAMSLCSIGLEVSYVFNSVQDWSQNEIQPSVSLKFNLPSK